MTDKNATNKNITGCLFYNMATTLLFNAMDREIKELLPYSIFIITRRYKRVKIHVIVEELSPKKKY